MVHGAWLVDMGFVVQAATDGQRFRLDYLAGRLHLERRLGTVAAHLFNSIDSSIGIPPGLQAFYRVVKNRGFGVHLIEMTGSPAAGTHRQQGVDEALIAELLAAAVDPEVDAIVLTSGDAHFVPAIEEARHVHGKKTILFAYDVNVSARLKAAVHEFWPFEQHRRALALPPPHRSRH